MFGIAQHLLYVGGIVCCIAIPLVILKAMKEIDETDQEPKRPNEISNQMNDLKHV